MAKGAIATAEQPSKPKPAVRFSDLSDDMLSEVAGDISIDEDVEVTVKGKVTGFHAGDKYSGASLELEITSVNGSTAKASNNNKELKKMDDYSMGKNNEED